MPLGKVDDGAQFALVALLILVDPGADGRSQAELVCDTWTSSPPPVDEYVRIARVCGPMILRSERICAGVGRLPLSGCFEP